MSAFPDIHGPYEDANFPAIVGRELAIAAREWVSDRQRSDLPAHLGKVSIPHL